MINFTHRTILACTILAALLLSACGGVTPKPAADPDKPDLTAVPAPEPDEPATAEEVETGSDCATAMALCEGGVCTVDVTNGCEAAVTCALEAMSLCRDATSTGEARGKARDTVPVGETVQLQAQGDCESAQIVATQLVSFRCQ